MSYELPNNDEQEFAQWMAETTPNELFKGEMVRANHFGLRYIAAIGEHTFIHFEPIHVFAHNPQKRIDELRKFVMMEHTHNWNN